MQPIHIKVRYAVTILKYRFTCISDDNGTVDLVQLRKSIHGHTIPTRQQQAIARRSQAHGKNIE